MTTTMLLEAIERGPVDFDGLLPECDQRWQYFIDEPYRLCRFPADDDPLGDPSSVGWIWCCHDDTWHVWSTATYEVFLPGDMWSDCPDVHVAKAAIRAWIATLESA